MPERVPLIKLLEIDHRIPKFHGKVISVGHTVYCGRMINTGRIPVTKPGFQVRVEYENDDDDDENEENNYPSNNIKTRNYPQMQSSNMKPDTNNESKVGNFFAPMITGCSTLFTMMNESIHDKFMTRFVSTTKLLGHNLVDVTGSVSKQSVKLIREYVFDSKPEKDQK